MWLHRLRLCVVAETLTHCLFVKYTVACTSIMHIQHSLHPRRRLQKYGWICANIAVTVSCLGYLLKWLPAFGFYFLNYPLPQVARTLSAWLEVPQRRFAHFYSGHLRTLYPIPHIYQLLPTFACVYPLSLCYDCMLQQKGGLLF